YAWGDNGYGQLGDGTNTSRNVPVLVQAPAGVTFTSISAGNSHSLALGSDGNTYAWGDNGYGQLGDGTNTSRNVPVLVLLDVIVTGVTFDGLPGTSIIDNGDGTWSVDTPAHVAGPVDVVVSWTLNGVAQTPVTYAGGFTYNPTPVTQTPVVNDPKGPEKSVDSSLAVTGSETQSALLIGALVALLLGAGIITANRIAKRRAHQ
ncbi:MAG: hypothetical protein RR853_07480, partial [Aurantimicrobium sp.]